MIIDSLKKLTLRIASLLKNKVDKESGKSLVSDTLITKLGTLTSVKSSEYLSDNKLKLTLSDNSTIITSNSPDLSSKVDKKVGYELIKSTDIELFKNKVDKVSGKSLISDTLISKLQSIDMDTKVDKVTGQGLISTTLSSDLASNWTALKLGINKYPTGVTISGTDTKKIIITLKDGSTLETQWVDLKGSDINFTGAGFDKATGSLKLNASTSFTLDGRYRLLSTPITWSEVQDKPTIPTLPAWVTSSKPTYSWNELTDKPTIPTLPSWVTQNKPTYSWNDIQSKPELNYLPLSGGVIQTNHSIEYAQGIRISKDLQNSWSILTLGTTGTSGLTSDSWMVARNPSGELQIQSTDANANTGMRFTNSLVYWKGNRILDMGWNTRNNKLVFNTELDNWLRINEGSHPLGTYFNNSIVRTDNQLQVGPEGIYFNAQNGYTLLSNHLRVTKWGDGNGIDAINNTGYLQFGSVNYITFRKTDSNYNWIGDPRLRIDFNSGFIECINSTITRNSSNAGYFMANFDGNPVNYYKPYPIFTINSTYSPTETTFNKMYGVGFTVGGSSGLLSSIVPEVEWGLYGAFNGIPKWFLSGSGIIHSTGGFRKVGSDDNHVLLAGGGTKPVSSFGSSSPQNKLLYQSIGNSRVDSTEPGIFRAGDIVGSPDVPIEGWASYFGGRHSNGNNRYLYNFVMPFEGNHDTFYFNNRTGNADHAWAKFIGFRDFNNNKSFKEHINPEGYAWHYNPGKLFGVYSGSIGSSAPRLIVNDDHTMVNRLFIRDKSTDDVLLNGSTLHKDNFFINRTNSQGAAIGTINTFKPYKNGVHNVAIPGEGGILAVFKLASSASSIELLVPGYGAQRLHFTHSIDDNRYAHPFKELAYFEDVYRVGGDISSNWTATISWQNGVIFIKNPVTIELNQLQHKGSMSFRKVFDGGQVTFVCSGKTIKYTGPTSFDGKDGSTAVISIFENKCYIDIRNV